MARSVDEDKHIDYSIINENNLAVMTALSASLQDS